MIFLGGIPFCGIRLLLKLVAMPAAIIVLGKIHGVLKIKNVSVADTVMITIVIVFTIATFDILYAENAMNPTDIG